MRLPVAAITTSSDQGGFEAHNLNDDLVSVNANERWATASAALPVDVTYDHGAAYVPTNYWLAPGFYPGQDPTAWTLRASNDPTFATYDTLDTRTGITWGGQPLRFEFTNATAYRYTRLHFTANGGGLTSASEWHVHDAEPDRTFEGGDSLITTDADTTTAFHVGLVHKILADCVVTHLRFFETVAMDGTVTLSLWDASGAWVTGATFTAHTGNSGVRDVGLGTPVELSAGDVVMVSVRTPNGAAYWRNVATSLDRFSGIIQIPANGTVTYNGSTSTARQTSPFAFTIPTASGTSMHAVGLVVDQTPPPPPWPDLAMDLDLSEVHQATITMTGMQPVTRLYTSPEVWSVYDGWSSGGDADLALSADGIQIEVDGPSGYAVKTVPSVLGTSDQRRVRALVVLSDTEDRPARVWISGHTGGGSFVSAARLVSGTPVIVEGWMPMEGPTTVRINVQRPAGYTGVFYVRVLSIIHDRVVDEAWTLTRSDANGTRVIARGSTVDPDGAVAPVMDPDDEGTLVIVDQEASLVGEVTWSFASFYGDVEESGPLLFTGYGVLQLAVYDTDMHEVFVRAFRGVRNAQVDPLPILGAAKPVVPARPLTSRRGTMTLWFDTLDAAETVSDVLGTGRALMLRQPETTRQRIDAYLVATGIDLDEAPIEVDPEKWQLVANYVETERPA